MPEPLLIAIMVGAVGLALAVSWVQRARTKRAWGAFAQRRDLEFAPGSLLRHPEVYGDLDGRRFHLWTFTRGSRKNKRRYTALELGLQGPTPSGLRIYRESLLSKVGKFLGTQDVETGDAEFDGAFMIKGDHPAEVREWLTPDRRWAILPLQEVSGGEVRQGTLYVEQRGVIRSTERLDSILARLREAADTIDAER